LNVLQAIYSRKENHASITLCNFKQSFVFICFDWHHIIFCVYFLLIGLLTINVSKSSSDPRQLLPGRSIHTVVTSSLTKSLKLFGGWRWEGGYKGMLLKKTDKLYQTHTKSALWVTSPHNQIMIKFLTIYIHQQFPPHTLIGQK